MTEQELLDIIEELVTQFAYPAQKAGMAGSTTGGLAALERGFAALGWSDPHPCPEHTCAYPGCTAWASCGTPTRDGSYKRCCYAHFRMYRIGDET